MAAGLSPRPLARAAPSNASASRAIRAGAALALALLAAPGCDVGAGDARSSAPGVSFASPQELPPPPSSSEGDLDAAEPWRGADASGAVPDAAPPDTQAPHDTAPDGAASDGAASDGAASDGGASDDTASDDTGPDSSEPDAGPSPPPVPCVPMAGDCDGVAYGKSKSVYSIVLAHGAAGFDEIGPLEYWWDIPDVLRKQGYEVHVAVVSPFDTALVRGAQLAAFVDKVIACTCRPKVNLVGHSQGGLDARYLVSSLGYHDRVASITTIGTPHRGTEVADLALGLLPGATKDLLDFVLWWVSGAYPNPFQQPDFYTALELFSLDGAAAFNEANPDHPDVAYYSWAGRAGLFADGKPECEDGELPNPTAKGPVQAAFVPGFTALGGYSGVDNDGLVTVHSAKWGRFRGCLPADHLREVGFWWGITPGFDYRAFFRDLADFLRHEGF